MSVIDNDGYGHHLGRMQMRKTASLRVQVTRVMQRDWALWSKRDAHNIWAKDGHVRTLYLAFGGSTTICAPRHHH